MSAYFTTLRNFKSFKNGIMGLYTTQGKDSYNKFFHVSLPLKLSCNSRKGCFGKNILVKMLDIMDSLCTLAMCSSVRPKAMNISNIGGASKNVWTSSSVGLKRLMISTISYVKRYNILQQLCYQYIQCIYIHTYRMEGNVGKFGEWSVIHQTKTIQISAYH